MDLTPMWFGVYKALKYLLYPLSWILIAGLLALLTACLPVSPGGGLGSGASCSSPCYCCC